jgi:hypothetical protein
MQSGISLTCFGGSYCLHLQSLRVSQTNNQYQEERTAFEKPGSDMGLHWRYFAISPLLQFRPLLGPRLKLFFLLLWVLSGHPDSPICKQSFQFEMSLLASWWLIHWLTSLPWRWKQCVPPNRR